VEHYAAAFIPNRLSGSLLINDGRGGDKRILLQWNPASPVSAKTLMVTAENRLGQINDAILICSPPALYRQPELLSPMEIMTAVDDQIKGWFFLIRELVLMFRRKNGGALGLVAPEFASGNGRDGPADLLGPSAAASFRAFSQGLLASASDEPFHILGFTASESSSSGSGEEAHFASYIFKNLEDGDRKNNGKWLKYSKLNILKRIM